MYPLNLHLRSLTAYASYNIFSNYFLAGRSKPTFDMPESPRPYKTFVLENKCLEMIASVKYRVNSRLVKMHANHDWQVY